MNYIHNDSPFIPASNSDNGITTRAYIAAQILPQLLIKYPPGHGLYAEAALHAVAYADALIRQLNKDA